MKGADRPRLVSVMMNWLSKMARGNKECHETTKVGIKLTVQPIRGRRRRIRLSAKTGDDKSKSITYPPDERVQG
jgi:hypothetical protein